MPDYKHILVGVDFSECSVSALREAVRIASWNQAAIHALHVIDPVLIEGIQDYEEVATDQIIARARKHLEEIAATEAPGAANLSLDVVIGHPFEELLRFASRHPDGLLLVGAHGNRDNRKNTGTVAAKCVRKAPLPVMLIRKSHDHHFRKIVAAIDFSANSMEAMRMGAKIARHEGDSLEIIHVHFPPWLQPTSVQYNLTSAPDSDYQLQYTAMLENKLERVANELRDEYPGLSIATHLVERSHAAYGIVDFLNECGADLAVMGTRGRTGIKVLLLGTTAERVVNESPCSVLTIKPEGFDYPL